MSFANDMERFLSKLHNRKEVLIHNVVQQAFISIRDGSAITGAPGQPVDEGVLIKSWRIVQVSRYVFRITTDDEPKASIIEDNRRGATLRSKVSGFHSVKLTRLGFRRILAHELEKMGKGRGNKMYAPRTPPKIMQARGKKGRFTRETGLTIG